MWWEVLGRGWIHFSRWECHWWLGHELVLRPQVMADSGMALRMPFQNAQQHTISEHPNYHSFKNIWQKNRSAKPLFKAFQNVYAVGGSGMAILSVFQNALKLMFQECCSKKGWKQKVPECQSADASGMVCVLFRADVWHPGMQRYEPFQNRAKTRVPECAEISWSGTLDL